MTAYATPEDYRRAFDRTGTEKDEDIARDLTAISRYLDGKLRRTFAADTEPVSRIYVPTDHVSGIWIDDLAAPPVSVKVGTKLDGSFALELDPGDYELLPLNADKKPEPWPWERIELTPWGQLAAFHPGERVQVTAKFGWPQIPEAIRSATIQLTAILRLESPRATRRIAELGDAIEASADAQSIIAKLTDQYKIWRA